jgi:hypothetical protein
MRYLGSQRACSSDDSVPIEPVVVTQAGRIKHAERRGPVGSAWIICLARKIKAHKYYVGYIYNYNIDKYCYIMAIKLIIHALSMERRMR